MELVRRCRCRHEGQDEIAWPGAIYETYTEQQYDVCVEDCCKQTSPKPMCNAFALMLYCAVYSSIQVAVLCMYYQPSRSKTCIAISRVASKQLVTSTQLHVASKHQCHRLLLSTPAVAVTNMSVHTLRTLVKRANSAVA
eukprot:20916-Heterococcus_DN1.PRE.3